MYLININGFVKKEEDAILSSSNRAFRYGDGLFESIAFVQGKAPLWDYHMDRLFKGLELVKFEIPPHFTSKFLWNEVVKLITPKSDFRIRITVYRSGRGLYAPVNDLPEFLIAAHKADDQLTEWPDKGLTITIFPTPVLAPAGGIHNLKSCNSLPYVLAARYARKQNMDDSLVLNTDKGVAESSNSNLFIVKGNDLFTPPLVAGCVNGVFRNLIFSYFSSRKSNTNLQLHEKSLAINDLLTADELFLTNATRGIRWVKQLDSQLFHCDITKQVHSECMQFLGM